MANKTLFHVSTLKHFSCPKVLTYTESGSVISELMTLSDVAGDVRHCINSLSLCKSQELLRNAEELTSLTETTKR